MHAETSPSESNGAEHPDLGADLRSAVARISRRFRSERPEGSLGDKALEVLTYLHKHGPQTLTALSAYDAVAPASMSQTVNRLAAEGYVTRAPDPGDRRRVFITSTVEGSALAEAAMTRRNTWLDDRLGALSAEDRRAIARASELLGDIASH